MDREKVEKEVEEDLKKPYKQLLIDIHHPQKCVKTTFLTRKPLKILDIIL